MIKKKKLKTPFKRIVLLICFLTITGIASAQSQAKKGIYYLVDTANVTKNDRMISFAKEGTHEKILGIIYTIEVKCLTVKNVKFKPAFLREIKTPGTSLTEIDITALPLIKLSDFINIICEENSTYSFEKAYNVYFIEPSKSGYLQHLVEILHPKVID